MRLWSWFVFGVLRGRKALLQYFFVGGFAAGAIGSCEAIWLVDRPRAWRRAAASALSRALAADVRPKGRRPPEAGEQSPPTRPVAAQKCTPEIAKIEVKETFAR